MRTLNLGILAHVDAGKTSLTERLLYHAGVIDRMGSVDGGSTQTDSLALERQRGITIKSAVVSFDVNDVRINLIDTPGHPDFIAEVERVLGVLDGAVLVVSAVEGVQAQTRVLMRALRRLRIPTLLFVNKIDRGGADVERTLCAVAERLTPAIVAMGVAREVGTRAAGVAAYGEADPAFTTRLLDVLADHDDAILAACLEGAPPPDPAARVALVEHTGQARVHPVFMGSAITGAGVDALVAGITRLLPAAAGDPDGTVAGTVFKVERGPVGERIAYLRVFSGTVRVRDRLAFGGSAPRKVTAIGVFEQGGSVRREALLAGQIGTVWGLGDVRIGDVLGSPRAAASVQHFAPPTLETVVVPCRPGDRAALHAALVQLAEQDPLIDLRRDAIGQELSLSLYGEVQKEVVQATLASDYGIDAEFRDSITLCVERPARTGAAFELIGRAPNPFAATVGLRVEPAAPGSGIAYRLEVERGSLPPSFHKAVEETVRETLRQGLRGWQVTGCTVTMTHSGYWSPITNAGDFRALTPLVVMRALARAGTIVCEPVHRFVLEVPEGALTALAPLLARLGAVPERQAARGAWETLEGVIPAAGVGELQRRLASLTRGEGLLEYEFWRYQPVSGPAPTRPRTDHNPLDRQDYLMRLQGRVRP
ncbi:MAG: TetM/TetW/TetO/TetS family tetracycline resistance ribosomal protection protein [Chloroflexi bacterium]|nr:MAG: TetM/TetW/TetO/TetS family tetracycline resistance ribosomal protection protein [Chloroflexota bacterium]